MICDRNQWFVFLNWGAVTERRGKGLRCSTRGSEYQTVLHIMWRLKKSSEENERSYPKWKTSLGSDCIFISTDLITAGGTSGLGRISSCTERRK